MIAATLLVSLVAVVQGAKSPGRALFWSSERGQTPATYKSQSSTFADVHNMLQDEMQNKDLVVTFCSEEESTHDFFSTPHFSASIKGAERATVMPNVYHTRDTADTTFCQLATESASMKDHQVATVDEMLATLSSATPTAHKNFLVPLLAPSDHTSASYEQLLAQLHLKNALIVGLQTPQVAAPATKGHYKRLLQNNDETNYNPEGTEFTIYYQNTYLYLTPDLFTGLMTFLFCAVVLLIGFSCLNQIQGPATFVHIMPTLGKEG